MISGGETSTGAAIVQLLHTTAADVKIVVTSKMADQERLLSRKTSLVELGATFAVNGAAPDFIDELRERMQEPISVALIVDVDGFGSSQNDLLALLAGERRLIDCANADVESNMRSLLDDGDIVAHIGKPMKAIGERMSQAREPQGE